MSLGILTLTIVPNVHMHCYAFTCASYLTYLDADNLNFALMLIPIRIWQSVLQFRPDTIFSL